MKTTDDLKNKYNLKIEDNLNSAQTIVFAHGFGSKLKKDVLIVQSEDDFDVPEVVADYLHHNLSKSRIDKIKADGHFPHISAPQEVVQAIQSFI